MEPDEDTDKVKSEITPPKKKKKKQTVRYEVILTINVLFFKYLYANPSRANDVILRFCRVHNSCQKNLHTHNELEMLSMERVFIGIGLT